jgi:fibronectin-binding autotransporter adhesin
MKQSICHRRISAGCLSSKRRIPLLTAALLGAALSAMSDRHAAFAGFTPGDLVVEQVGDGVNAPSDNGNAVFLDDFTTAGVAGTQVTIPSTGSNALVVPGTSGPEGFVTPAPNGLSVVLAGFNYSLTNTPEGLDHSTDALRGVGTVSIDGTYNLVGTTTSLSGQDSRSAATDGAGGYWITGYFPMYNSGNGFSGAATTVSTSTNNSRVIHDYGGTVYFSNGSGKIFSLANPTTAGGNATATLLFAIGNAYDFSINTAGTVAYVAGNTSRLQKWVNTGGVWSLAYNVTSTSLQGLAVDWSNPNKPVLYATNFSGSTMFKIVDNGAGSPVTSLAVAPTNELYKSLSFAGLPSVWTATSSGNFSTGTAGSLYSSWSLGLANGINLSFQDVNSTATPLPIEATNNSAITSASSMVFGSGGYGQLAGGTGGTQYTVDGTGLTLTGTAATGSGITNNSVSTQTINLPLTLGAAQTIKATAGNLSFGGATLALGGGSQNYALTIDGAFNTTISNAISDGGTGAGGTLTKNGSGTLTLSNTNSYSGGTTINAGILVAGNGLASVGSGDITVNGGSAIFSNTTTTAVFNLIKSGFNSGSGYWNGHGINSATAAGDTTHLTTVGMMQPAVATTYNGQSLGTADVAVKYTYYGDANLDGTVDGADYQQIDNGFGMGLTGWQNGDFNYDGVVDGSDFSLIDNTFNQITATGASPLAILAGPALASASAVPEPTTLGLLSIGAISLLSRRRRIQV